MAESTLEAILPPVQTKMEGADVTIYEVLKSRLVGGATFYIVVVSIGYRGVKTRRFSIPVTSMEDLRRKLMVEISKLKLMLMVGEQP